MKSKNSHPLITTIGCIALLTTSHSLAQSGDWSTNTGAIWATAVNWSPAVVPGNNAGDVVTFTNDVDNNRTIQLQGFTRTVGSFTVGDSNDSNTFTFNHTGSGKLVFDNGTSNAFLIENGSKTDTISAPITLNSALLATVNGALNLSGPISGGSTSSFTKEGIGTLTLNNTTSNNYSGGFNFNAGVLASFAANTTANGFGTGLLTINGGSGLRLLGSGSRTLTINNDIVWNQVSTTLARTTSGTPIFDFNGNVTLGANVTINVGSTEALSVIFDGNIGDGGAGHSLSFIGGSGSTENTMSITFNGTNTFTGNLSTTNSRRSITVGGAGSLNSGNYAGSITSAGLFTYASSVNQTLSGVISTVGLTKSGSSTLTLTSTSNSYSGTTSVLAGTLQVDGNTPGGTVTVGAAATLSGTGLIGGNTTIADGGTIAFAINSPAASHDHLELAAAKTIIFSGASTLTLTTAGGAEVGDYTLLTAPGGFGSSAAPATVNLPPGWLADAPRFEGNDLKINITSTSHSTPNLYLTWAGSEPFDGDANGDGVSNGLAFMLGAASPTANALNLLPVVSQSTSGLIMSFSVLNAANRGAVTMNVQYSSDLGLSDTWASVAVPETSGSDGGVTFVITPGATSNTVQVTIPATESAAGKLFGRLRTVNP